MGLFFGILRVINNRGEIYEYQMKEIIVSSNSH